MDAVANWLWQGIVVAAAAAVLVRAPRSLGAAARYWLWWAAMAIVLALPAAPFLAAVILPAPAAVALAQHVTPASQDVPVRIGAPSWAPIVLASVWGLWTALAAARVLAALSGLGRARRAARPFPSDRVDRLRHWASVSATGRPAALVISEDVRYAAVLGGRTPVIAVAPAVAAALDDRDLDRIVVHEWAHVQRRDDRARLVQLIVRAVAGLHPAVWWLDRQIHIDRETACDEWAVDVTGSAKSYAASLTRLAATVSRSRDEILLPAAITSSELTCRVMRLLDDRRTTSTRRRAAASALVVPALGAAAFAVAGVPLIAIDLEALAGPSASAIATADSTDERQVAPPARAAEPTPIAAPPSRRSTANGRPAPPEPEAPMPAQTPAPVPQKPPASPPRSDPDYQPVPAAPREVAGGLTVRAPAELPGEVTAPGPAVPLSVAPWPQTAYDAATQTPWGAAADAGVNVGRGSQKAAVATAGFFSKLGKSIARSF